ncbi:MAG: TolC family protein [Parabacteroides sp.]|nr:TolC family protein [Parabacteroides sp.]
MKRLYILILCAGSFVFPSLQAQKVYTLAECRQMALDNNVKIKNGRLAIEQAREQEKEAFSKYFPAVSASGTYFRSNNLLTQKISLTQEDQQQLGSIISKLGLDPSALASLPTSFTLEAINHGTMVNLMAMQPVFAGGQIINGNKLAKLQTDVRRLQLEQSKDDILSTTESYYNQLLSLCEKQRTLDIVDIQLQRIHQDAENSFKVGISNKNDVLSVELKQNEVAANRLKLDNGIKLCKMVLAQYVGIFGEDIHIDTTLISNLPEPSVYLVDHEASLDNRTEAKLLDKNVEASVLQRKLKQGALLPSVAIGAASAYQDLSNTGHVKVLGLATVNIPISDWWGSNHSVRRQKIAEKIARQDREDNRQMLLIQMQNAFNNLDNAYKQILLARKSLEKSAENLRLNEDYYQAGTSTMSDLLGAQSQSQQARDQYTDAVTQYLNSRTSYFIATGRSVSE